MAKITKKKRAACRRYADQFIAHRRKGMKKSTAWKKSYQACLKMPGTP